MAVELLTSREHINATVLRLTVDARHEVRVCDRPPYFDGPGSNLDSQLQQQRRGVIYRVIYDREAVAWPGRLKGCTPDEDSCMPSPRKATACNPDQDGSDCSPAETPACEPSY
ncbi:hypothetical protein [Streptomyces mirabilis]|uniref:hypothetical protein n=1 Tax=Streptomyces mirabilis TaxID=68239 RepID=UPI003821E00E